MSSASKLFIFFWFCFFASESCAITTKLEYGGVSFICKSGCGYPSRDDDAYKILLLFHTIEDQLNHFYPYASSEYLPYGLLETKTWYEQPCHSNLKDKDSAICRQQAEFLSSFENLKKNFLFKKNRHYQELRKEKLICEENITFLQNRLQDPNIHRSHLVNVRNGRVEYPSVFISADTWDTKSFLEDQQEKLKTILQDLGGNNGYSLWQAKLEEAYIFIDSRLREIFFWCLEHHQREGISFRNALEALLQKDYVEAMHWLRELLNALNEESFSSNQIEKVHLLRGQLELEYGLHAQAIESFSTVIAKHPQHLEAYFERAAAYFESGHFEKAIEDFLHYDSLSMSSETKLTYTDITAIGLGIAKGIIKGTTEGCVDYIPEILHSCFGLTHGLWAFCSHPISASRSFVDAAINCINYLEKHSTKEILEQMVPELRELIEQFNTLENFEKGEAIGQIVGKFGTDILLTKGTGKLYRHLRAANQSMTLQALSSSTDSSEIIKEAVKYHAQRQKILESANLKVQWDKQGKHLKGHRNYDPSMNKSVFEHPAPEKLIKEHAGKGRKTLRSTGDCGQPGYQELIDFEEYIGYHVSDKTGAKTATTKGTIHYAKDGVHIVPAHPEQ